MEAPPLYAHTGPGGRQTQKRGGAGFSHTTVSRLKKRAGLWMKLISLPLSMAERRCFLDSFEKQDVNRAKYSGLCLSFRNPRKKTNMGKGNIASNRIVSSGAGKKKNRAENRDATEEKVFLHYPREPNSFAPI